jgi:hypothetical protein
MAFPASPFLAIGNPSIIVAVLPEVPGAPRSILVIAPAVNDIADIPNIKASAAFFSSIKTKGSRRASPVTPSRPGNIPKNNPIIVPSENIKIYIGVNSCVIPDKSASTKESPPFSTKGILKIMGPFSYKKAIKLYAISEGPSHIKKQ